MAKKRKILGVTGSRSEYDLVYNAYKAIDEHPDLELEVLVTGAHLSESFGSTYKFIEEDGFKIADKVYSLVNTDKKIGRVMSLGNQIAGMAQTIERIKPDFTFISGDREESLSVPITSAYLDIPCAHLFGGDIVKDGYIDNQVRYAASKMSHIHFTAHPLHSKTIELLGEDSWRIFNTGNPALDRFKECPNLSRKELSENLQFDIENDPYIMVILHPSVNKSEDETINDTIEFMEALIASGKKILLNSPNSDPGNFQIRKVYEKYANNDKFFFFYNLERVTYINCLRHALCLLGNSSSGLIETPSVGIPAINVGPRQRDRLCSNNIEFVDFDREQISKAIDKAINDENYRAEIKKTINPYGDGESGKRIAEIFASIDLSKELIYKNITYDFKDYE